MASAIMSEDAPTALPVTAPVINVTVPAAIVVISTGSVYPNITAKTVPRTKAKLTPTIRETAPISPERFNSDKLAP